MMWAVAVQELTLTWPQRVQDMPVRQELALRLDGVLQRTGTTAEGQLLLSLAVHALCITLHPGD